LILRQVKRVISTFKQNLGCELHGHCRDYCRRWDIEVVFRFLKQELNLKHLINQTYDGIMIQIYSALVAAFLIAAFKKIEGYKIEKIQFEDELLKNGSWNDLSSTHHLSLSNDGETPDQALQTCSLQT